ncbi:BamA/TamA family outer membrane protein [Parabacteroides sp. PF5-9]|uniref:translocation and assembly module lipoprotein TamL n=1 Tax=Parabacteroides sp. PF5-9 TaxID=1742404 RepID=UPI002476B80F|nr:BamA/TamA family outer membrane protein [Parabacteroides sp. PF5-9]MDH6357979.1 outer membrane protein assembly factor BamA [Parabacteroides sp. PF5-9]
MMNKEISIHLLIYGFIVLLILAGCSTTRNLPEGEILYTGIERIEVVDLDKTPEGDLAMQEVEAALDYAPNNSLFGSSTTRLPLPVGLWIYNSFQKYKGGLGKWIFEKFAAKPVFITTVNPDVRVAVAHNVLRENGYFNGQSAYEIIPDKKDSLKAKISYHITMNQAYRYDSIRYMSMRHFVDTIISANLKNTLLRKDQQFNVVKMENERQRISSDLRNNGFYYYRPEYIVYQADTLISPGKVWLQVARKDGTPPNALTPYRIGKINIHIGGYNGEKTTDSLVYKDMTIFYEGKLHIRPAVLYERLRFKPGDLYTLEEQQRTQTGLSRLNAFRYAEFQYAPRRNVRDSVRRGQAGRNPNQERLGMNMLDSLQRRSSLFRQNNILDVNINTVYDLPYDGEFEINASTKDNNYAGPGAIFSLTRRNAFKGGEIVGLQLRGAYEWQTGNQGGGNKSKINSYELGLSSTLTIPFILFPGYIYRDLKQPSSTTFKVSGDLLNRPKYFKMLSFSGSMTYDFRPTSTTRHQISPLRLTYNKLNPTQFFSDSVASSNQGLYESLKSQFIPAMSYTFTYDNSPVSDRSNFSWSTTITEAGNLIDGTAALFGKAFNKKGKELFGVPFAQFIKGTTEARYNHRIDRKNRLVVRAMAGVIYSYGNATISPYSEQFYIGGANSVRAFTIRSIGPGRFDPPRDPEKWENYQNPYAYIDRIGDIKFEANLEYRFNVAGALNGALFMDWGGIWGMRADDRSDSRLKAGEFLNDMALGTGAGLRYDLSFLLLRLDFGFGLHVPYKTDKSGYFNVNPFDGKYNAFNWHLAVGYPF